MQNVPYRSWLFDPTLFDARRFVGNEYWMFYAGGADTTLDVWKCDMGLATSKDGINFTKSANNPLVAASWTDYGMNAASSMIFHDTLRVYYSGLTFTPSIMPTIGFSYLDSTLITTVNDTDASAVPSGFDLVNENQTAGIYSIVWDDKNDAGELATSGMYFYKLKIGEVFIPTRKMVF